MATDGEAGDGYVCGWDAELEGEMCCQLSALGACVCVMFLRLEAWSCVQHARLVYEG